MTIRHHRFPHAQGPVPDPSRGVFETILVVDGAPLELDQHLSRLTASVEELYGIRLPEQANELVEREAAKLSLARLRLNAIPVDDDLVTDVVVGSVEPQVVNPRWENGTRLTPFTTIVATGSHKWADRRRLENMDAAAGGLAPLLVGGEGEVLETSRGNVFIVSDGALTTPPLDGRILPGVTRSIALDLARQAGFQARETNIGFDDLLAADESFVTGSVRGIEPVLSCADTEWQPGPLTTRIAAELRQRWPQIDLASAVDERPA